VHPLSRAHVQRLRAVWRGACWPAHDNIELDLLGVHLQRVFDDAQRESLRVTDAGLQALQLAHRRNQAAFGAHEALVNFTAQRMAREQRWVWTALSLRAKLLVQRDGEAEPKSRWIGAMPDVFSIRHTSRADWLQPIAHEVKVRRADVLSDLKKPHKAAAYRQMAGQCWYVLGGVRKKNGWEPVADASEIPLDYGVIAVRAQDPLTLADAHWEVLRHAPAHAVKKDTQPGLPFGTWMALARATPWHDESEPPQAFLGDTA
jgi:hypothetical protein